MGEIIKSLTSLLNHDSFNTLSQKRIVTIAEINAAIAVLIKLGIPFTLSFTPGNQAFAAAAQLTINFTPTATVAFTFAFEAGPTEFDNI